MSASYAAQNEKEHKLRAIWNRVYSLSRGDSALNAIRQYFEAALSVPVQSAVCDDGRSCLIVAAVMSAGKSTLINAMLGTKIMPAANSACTSKIIRVSNGGDATGFSAELYDTSNPPRRKSSLQHVNGARILQLNSKDDSVGMIRLIGRIPFAEGAVTDFEIVDTPGVDNTINKQHRKITEAVLRAETNKIVIFVMDATRMNVDDEKELLRLVLNIFGTDGAHAQDRIIFVISKLDCYKKAEDDMQAALAQVREYLKQDFGMNNPRIFPVSARAALDVRRYQQARTDDEREDILDNDDDIPNLRTLARKLKNREQLHLENFADIEPYVKHIVDAELRSAQMKGDIYAEALVHSGVRCLEETLRREKVPAQIVARRDADIVKAVRVLHDYVCALLKGKNDEVQSVCNELQQLESVIEDINNDGKRKMISSVRSALSRLSLADERKTDINSVIHRLSQILADIRRLYLSRGDLDSENAAHRFISAVQDAVAQLDRTFFDMAGKQLYKFSVAYTSTVSELVAQLGNQSYTALRTRAEKMEIDKFNVNSIVPNLDPIVILTYAEKIVRVVPKTVNASKSAADVMNFSINTSELTSEALKYITDSLESAKNVFKSVPTLLESATDSLKSIPDTLKSAADAGMESVSDFIKRATDGLTGMFSKPSQSVPAHAASAEQTEIRFESAKILRIITDTAEDLISDECRRLISFFKEKELALNNIVATELAKIETEMPSANGKTATLLQRHDACKDALNRLSSDYDDLQRILSDLKELY